MSIIDSNKKNDEKNNNERYYAKSWTLLKRKLDLNVDEDYDDYDEECVSILPPINNTDLCRDNIVAKKVITKKITKKLKKSIDVVILDGTDFLYDNDENVIKIIVNGECDEQLENNSYQVLFSHMLCFDDEYIDANVWTTVTGKYHTINKIHHYGERTYIDIYVKSEKCYNYAKSFRMKIIHANNICSRETYDEQVLCA